MVKKSNLYTKTGDEGETSLVSGSRFLKSDLRIKLYGEVDELNSWIGLLVSQIGNEKLERNSRFFQNVQSSLFNLGSLLAFESELWEKYKLPQIPKGILKECEELIDEMDSLVPKLKNFILPGGSVLAANAHIARTKCRAVERSLVEFKDKGFTTPIHSLSLLNRLSDQLFVFARYVNLLDNKKEIIWDSKGYEEDTDRR